MFQSIAQSFSHILKKWSPQRIKEQEKKALLEDIKKALINADAAYEAVSAFIQNIEPQLLTESHDHSPLGLQLQAKIHHALVNLLGHPPSPPLRTPSKIRIILMTGLQGAGKTTTTIKLARWIKEHEGKTCAVASVDFQRPAAREQLHWLAAQQGIPVLTLEAQQEHLWKSVIERTAQAEQWNTLIVDTAGRLHIDDDLMNSLKRIERHLNPTESFFVLDSQTGQDAARSAQAFHAQLHLTGCILTKCDAKSNAGAALSVRVLTQQPILFLGTGEKTDKLELFNPENVANQMLDLGNAAALMDNIKKNLDKKETEAQAMRLARGEFSLEDMLMQIKQIHSMGGLSSIAGMLPGAHSLPDSMKSMIDDQQIVAFEALILSMTPKERKHPALINQPSRRERIIKGSGRHKKELQSLLKQYERLSQLIKKFSGSKFKLAMNMLKQKLQ